MTTLPHDTPTPSTIGQRAQIVISEQTVADIAEVLGWYGLPPHDADKAAREVLATITLAGTAAVEHRPTPVPQPAPPQPAPAAAAAAGHSPVSPPGTALAVVPSLIDVDFAGLTLPDPTASTARAWVKDRYGELVVDDGVRYRTPAEAEADGRHLVAAGQPDLGLALIAAARRSHELTAARRSRRWWPFRATRQR